MSELQDKHTLDPWLSRIGRLRFTIRLTEPRKYSVGIRPRERRWRNAITARTMTVTDMTTQTMMVGTIVNREQTESALRQLIDVDVPADLPKGVNHDG